MFGRAELNKTDEYFVDGALRNNNATYFCRLVTFNEEIDNFLRTYLQEVVKNGLYIKGKIPNPDERQLSYYEEIMGLNFTMDRLFFENSIKKWLPRLDAGQRRCIAEAMHNELDQMKLQGKTENMLKNAYIKFMCWFYYKFERILNQLGKEKFPKILYEGIVSVYELKVLSILSRAGCDILLLQCDGDSAYLKLDPKSEISTLINIKGSRFPANFSVSQMQQRKNEEQSLPKIEVEKPQKTVNTNTWLFGDVFSDSVKSQNERGTDSRFLYNLFARVMGAEEKATYYNELLKWKLKLESKNRVVVIIENGIAMPDALEVQSIKRKNYLNTAQMLKDMVENINFQRNKELEKYARLSFISIMEEDKETSLQKLSNRAVIFLCWINRYVPKLFESWQVHSTPTLVHYGGCKGVNEAYFIRLMAKLPVDVLIICPDLATQCSVTDKFLYEKKFENSLPQEDFPTEISSVRFGTVAYNAERELDTILYQDTGVYRNRQFIKAMPISLQTTYEEIKILWPQEAKYRPNFETLDDRVMMPVIFSKISGVPNGKDAYWNEISSLINDDTFVIKSFPYIQGTDFNPVKQHAPLFLKNGKLLAQKIKGHPSYQYSFMREDMQDYMLDKLQELIDSRIIRGTFTNGAEYTIVATALNLDKHLLRLIQKMDFTKDVPKVIIINTTESMCTIEDSILVAYLNILGFDIAMFIPTGYQGAERYFENSLFVEHQIGEYIYDLNVPEFKSVKKQAESIAGKLFRRGR
ncbi:MAG: YceG family protein [Anaerotignaceae bacterium]